MSKKLVIRINNLPEDTESNVAEEVVIYHWDRIITFTAVVALLIALLAWGLVHFTMQSSPLENTDSEHAEISAGSSVVSLEALPERNEVVTVAEIAKPVSDNGLSQSDVNDVVDADVMGANTQHETEAQDSLPEESEVHSDRAPETELLATPDVSPATDIIVTQTAQPEKQPADIVAAFVNPVMIHDPRLVRAQLTHQIADREPVEKLGGTIPMSEAGIIRVYLFTDMEGLAGETVYHDWYLGDKRMARVALNVRYDRTRASSSKYINKQMTGDWRVQVTTKSGDLLVSAHFTVPAEPH